MKKVWVKVKSEKDVDEEELQVVEIYRSQPHEFTYLIFLEK
jgi:hypothetical protein